MSKGLRKASLQGNVYGALPLTGNGETVGGVLPRAGHKEMERLRARRLEFAMMDPAVLQYMNSKRKQAMLLEAFAVIRELQAQLESLNGLKTQLPRKDNADVSDRRDNQKR
jgi:hypothetical protein